VTGITLSIDNVVRHKASGLTSALFNWSDLYSNFRHETIDSSGKAKPLGVTCSLTIW
jgi:hypothetical protein